MDGGYRLATSRDARIAFSASSPDFKLSATAGVLSFDRTESRDWIGKSEDNTQRLSETGNLQQQAPGPMRNTGGTDSRYSAMVKRANTH